MSQSPATTATPAVATTYTTILISPADVISRSLQNLNATVSRLRPWPELIASGTFNRPDSFASGLSRLRINLRYFHINYAIVVSICGALALIGSPFALILFSFIFALWLLLYFFREDPLVLWGYQLSDRLVFIELRWVIS
uniref:PRA1 family protein n=1 Tax=Manihot esculenta TaxID=3983 RepID=A0A2C9WJ51_MANES